jgi:D-3-phosphoglycerate dehydrogenase
MALGLGMKVIAAIVLSQSGCKVDFFDGQSITTIVSHLLNHCSKSLIYHFTRSCSRWIHHRRKGAAMMKNDVGIVNCARGGVIDEVALVKALDSGKVLFAGLDVF